MLHNICHRTFILVIIQRVFSDDNLSPLGVRKYATKTEIGRKINVKMSVGVFFWVTRILRQYFLQRFYILLLQLSIVQKLP